MGVYGKSARRPLDRVDGIVRLTRLTISKSPGETAMTTWQVQEAKARLSELLKKAAAEGPQSITVRGCPTAVVLSQEDFERLQGTKLGFVELMRSSPLVGVELDLRRDSSPTREVNVA
jgi:prevent-host-death family protein